MNDIMFQMAKSVKRNSQNGDFLESQIKEYSLFPKY